MDEANELLYEEKTYKIIGACMKVHRNLGSGFLESVYQESVERELTKQAVEFNRQVRLQLTYDGQPLKKYFIADFVCFQEIIIEIKAASFLNKIMETQTINYLKSTGLPVGLLINFGQQSLTWKRFINTKSA
ncbi:GxxExxY protein [Salegentibacter sp. JZCK2]|uniref:GxxExxY protein n=1 Tax=Salegentibacter tibetensis TaxID=2873600 RepID=UPI001CCBBE77|nr:GxxExxY protein [Salegentibacter tibetensis]MBZ9729088.1 GxxExxY protein [Salegentibacter tibetensis]